ncbi:MAG: TerB family tellurite resistance protein [Deltaproteobacteria bacterium]|nr:TerB family tellurite resistance protein [Deltaproteobacteria bacterium]
MDQATGRKICELVAGIIAVDGELHEAENALLVRLLDKTGLPRGDEVVLAPVLDAGEAARTMRQLPPAVRKEAMALLIEAAVVDGKVVPVEQRYLEAVADALGMGQDELEERVADRLMASRA